MIKESSKPSISIKKSSGLIDETKNEDIIKENGIKNERQLGIIKTNDELKNNENLIDIEVNKIDNNSQKDISSISISVLDDLNKDKNINTSNVKKNTMIQKEPKKKRIKKSEKEKKKKKEEREKEKEKSNKNKELFHVANPWKKHSKLKDSDNKQLNKIKENSQPYQENGSSERNLKDKNKEILEDDDNSFDKMEYDTLIEKKMKKEIIVIYFRCFYLYKKIIVQYMIHVLKKG